MDLHLREIPDEAAKSLAADAERLGKSVEAVAIDRICGNAGTSEDGSANGSPCRARRDLAGFVGAFDTDWLDDLEAHLAEKREIGKKHTEERWKRDAELWADPE